MYETIVSAMLLAGVPGIGTAGPLLQLLQVQSGGSCRGELTSRLNPEITAPKPQTVQSYKPWRPEQV